MYYHEFTIEASAFTDLPSFEANEFTLSFALNEEGEICDFDLIKIDDDPNVELEISHIEFCEGYSFFWDRVEDACQREAEELVILMAGEPS